MISLRVLNVEKVLNNCFTHCGGPWTFAFSTFIFYFLYELKYLTQSDCERVSMLIISIQLWSGLAELLAWLQTPMFSPQPRPCSGLFCVFIWGCLNAGSLHPLDQQSSQPQHSSFPQAPCMTEPERPVQRQAGGSPAINCVCLTQRAGQCSVIGWGALCDSRLGDRERQREMGKGGRDEVIPRW